MTNEEFINALGCVKVSSIRERTLKCLGNEFKTPTNIKKETKLSISQVSTALTDLKRENLVVCLNEHKRKGRIYKCTELGHEIIEYLEKTNYRGFD